MAATQLSTSHLFSRPVVPDIADFCSPVIQSRPNEMLYLLSLVLYLFNPAPNRLELTSCPASPACLLFHYKRPSFGIPGTYGTLPPISYTHEKADRPRPLVHNPTSSAKPYAEDVYSQPEKFHNMSLTVRYRSRRCVMDQEMGVCEGNTHVMHGRSRMAVDPRIATMPGRSTSGFHRPGRHCMHQVRSAVMWFWGRELPARVP